MENARIKSFLLAAVLLFNTSAWSAYGAPKVALVLSGGGAKGLAEIPLLEALEEEGIKPDIVLGTSMGALIGSLYWEEKCLPLLQKVLSRCRRLWAAL